MSDHLDASDSMSEQSWVPGPPASIVKFDVICPQCDVEMTTGGRDLAPGERATAYCPKCGHSVVIRVTRP